MEKVLSNLEALNDEAAHFVSGLKPGINATLVTLTGELGAGKTAYVKAAAKALGVNDIVTSPTFVLEKIYPLESGIFKNLIHIDAYRLEQGETLEVLHFYELMKEAGNLIMFEWPERVAQMLPASTVAISLEALPDGSRRISYA